MLTLLRWPLTALGVWTAAWASYLLAVAQSLSPMLSMWLGTATGLLASALARRWGASTARCLALGLGFPVSVWFLGASTLPSWAWLVPLGLVIWIYPVHAWRDAPVFPTPLNALKGLPEKAMLHANAKILDAGCGAGDGLKALRRAYPEAQCVGLEWSRPLSWVARLRCPWAQVRCGDIWQENWGAYDLVYLFQRPETMPRAVEKARTEMKSGAWLVSLEFEARALHPTATTEASPGRTVWLYQLPFKP